MGIVWLKFYGCLTRSIKVMGHVDSFAIAKTRLQLANSPTPWVDMFIMVML